MAKTTEEQRLKLLAEYKKLTGELAELEKERLKQEGIFLTKKREELIDALNSGEGDVVAGNLRVTPERLEKVDFTLPVLRNVKEIIVAGPKSPKLERVIK